MEREREGLCPLVRHKIDNLKNKTFVGICSNPGVKYLIHITIHNKQHTIMFIINRFNVQALMQNSYRNTYYSLPVCKLFSYVHTYILIRNIIHVIVLFPHDGCYSQSIHRHKMTLTITQCKTLDPSESAPAVYDT